MICPYCNEEMTLGKLMANRRIAWSEDGHRKYALYEKEGEITLASSMNVAKIDAYRCANCRKLIIEEI